MLGSKLIYVSKGGPGTTWLISEGMRFRKTHTHKCPCLCICIMYCRVLHGINSKKHLIVFTPMMGGDPLISTYSINKNIRPKSYTNNSNLVKKDTRGDRTMVAAATIVSMAAAKKAQQNVFALYHSYNRTILLRFIWILDFHFKIVLVLRRRYLIPIRSNNGKRKMWP